MSVHPARRPGERIQSAASPAIGIEWDYRPTDLSDLVDETPAIVLAQVEAVREGPDFSAPAVDDPGAPPFTVPTQRVDLRVTKAIEGQTPSSFTLFDLGNSERRPEEDPPYVVGERYLLFVRHRLNDQLTAPNPDDTWLVVAPDGRLEKLSSGKLDATADGAVADELDGETVTQAQQDIDEAQVAP